MLQSREFQIGVVLVVVGVVLSIAAMATGWPDWLIVVLFVLAAVVTYVAWPGKRSDR